MKRKKQTKKKLIEDISLMAMDSECRLFVGTDDNISVEEAMSHCKLPESVFEYQRETGCSYEVIIDLFDRTIQLSNMISMFMIRVEGLEVTRHSNYQILTADYNRAKNYIEEQENEIEYEIAEFKKERLKKCKHALKEAIEGQPIPIEETYNDSLYDRVIVEKYIKDIRTEGEQVVIGNAVGIRFYNHYLEEKRKEFENKISLIEKKIYICLYNEAIDGSIIFQDGHYIVGRVASRLINNLKEDLDELQEDYDYKRKLTELIESITGLEDMYYAEIEDTDKCYSFNQKEVIEYLRNKIGELKKREWEGTDLFNVNYFILDAINTNIHKEIVSSLL